MLETEIAAKLAEYIDPYLKQDLFTTKAVKKISVDKQKIALDITLGYPCNSLKDNMIREIQNLLSVNYPDYTLEINIQQKIDFHAGFKGIKNLPNIKNIIAVGSGKGGVGKSTISVNLALALAKYAQVGLLDADIYGPSLPMMLGTQGIKPELIDKTLSPIEVHGLKTMSIGNLIEAKAPMVWRGPMLGKALQQLLVDTKWQDLDYLIIDLPPGTGDIQLTLCQKIPLSGAIIVTTPQDLALLDVKRACEMFNKLNVPLLGIVENMSYFHCPKCGNQAKLFGEGGGTKLANEYQLDMLASIPLDMKIGQLTDKGTPPALNNDLNGKLFSELAFGLAAKLSLQVKSYSSTFPKIVIE